MAQKEKELYITVFQKIRELYPAWNVFNVMCDYEAALHAAVLEVFPQCTIRGCWFHYSQVRKISPHGMAPVTGLKATVEGNDLSVVNKEHDFIDNLLITF